MLTAPEVPAVDRRGFTLVEIMVAILLLTVGVLALTGTSAVVAKQMGRSTSQTVAANVAQSRFDSLTALSCATLASGGTTTGTASTRSVTEKWVVTDGNDVKNLSDTIRVPGRTNALVYTSIIPCRD